MDKWTREEALDYIQQNVVVDRKTGCHLWTGPRNAAGYGQVGPGGLIRAFGIKGAHRLVVHLHHGHEFAGRHEQVMHSSDCSSRACCNPDHLNVGTAKENMSDQRTLANMRASQVGMPHKARMGAHNARAVKLLLAAGVRIADIARLMNLSWHSVYNIKAGRSWEWVAI